jgi:hypothetical protein
MTLEEASTRATVHTLDSLGSHRMESTLVRRKRHLDAVVEESVEQFVIVWQDWDDFRTRRVRDGKVVAHALVVRGNLWTLGQEGRLAPGDDAEPYRADLRLSWDPWDESLEAFKERVQLGSPADDTIAERAALRYTVSLLPETRPAGSKAPPDEARLRPLVLVGNVWIDKDTALRLKADVTGRWAPAGGDPFENEITFTMERSRIGQVQDLKPPGESAIGQRAQPPLAPKNREERVERLRARKKARGKGTGR